MKLQRRMQFSVTVFTPACNTFWEVFICLLLLFNFLLLSSQPNFHLFPSIEKHRTCSINYFIICCFVTSTLNYIALLILGCHPAKHLKQVSFKAAKFWCSGKLHSSFYCVKSQTCFDLRKGELLVMCISTFFVLTFH